MGIHWEESSLSFVRIERKTPVLRPTLQSNQNFLGGSTVAETKGKRTKFWVSQNKASSWRKKAEKQEDHRWKEAKVQRQERIFAEHLDRLKRREFCDFEKLHKRAH